jgi:hypothetical protein
LITYSLEGASVCSIVYAIAKINLDAYSFQNVLSLLLVPGWA